ncbi:MAG: hypothetical protein V4580_00850 [Bacteroidota bacterium]
MAKKEKKTATDISNKLSEFEAHEVLYKMQSMDLEIDKKKTNLLFRKFIYLFIAISSCFSLWNFMHNLPILSGLVFSIPSSAILTVDPKIILDLFKKRPP